MKIVLTLKQVPDREYPLRLGPDGVLQEDSQLQYVMNESDACALEEALCLKDKLGAEIVVVSVGPPRVESMLRDALARGANRAIHIHCDEQPSRDALGIAELLFAVIRPENPDLVLTGMQSDDLGQGQTGIILATLLGIPYATMILEFQLDHGLTATRELDEGWLQEVSMPTPALLTVQSGHRKLRYATLLELKRSKAKPLTRVDAAELNLDIPRSVYLERFTLPRIQCKAELVRGTPQETAAVFVKKLKQERNLL
jgi:electron transfer flavoprotein beta subunit